MQCNVEFGYQLSICSGNEENHGKPGSSWPVAGPSGCKLTSSQQSGIKYATPNISPYVAVALFIHIYILFYSFSHMHTSDDQKTVVYNFVCVCVCVWGGESL
jgi:hypothetical protein